MILIIEISPLMHICQESRGMEINLLLPFEKTHVSQEPLENSSIKLLLGYHSMGKGERLADKGRELGQSHSTSSRESADWLSALPKTMRNCKYQAKEEDEEHFEEHFHNH